MPTIDIEPGSGIDVNEDGEIVIKVDKDKESQLKVSDDGLWAKGVKRLSDKCVDEWTVITKPDEEDSDKTIRGNGRVISKIRIFGFMKHKRKEITTNDGKQWYLKCKDPNSATADDLKDADDIVRELNLASFYSDGTNHAPMCVPRPGTLIGFSDAIYGTTKYSSRVYEDGKRFPTLVHYKSDGTTETMPQHLYALFMVTRITYTNYSAKYNIKSYNLTEDFPSVVGTDYKLCYQIEMQCLWSDQEAYNGLLNKEGWHKGEFLKGRTGNNYGKWDENDIYDGSNYSLS